MDKNIKTKTYVMNECDTSFKTKWRRLQLEFHIASDGSCVVTRDGVVVPPEDVEAALIEAGWEETQHDRET